LGPCLPSFFLRFLFKKRKKKEKRREPPKKTAWEKAFYLVVKDVFEVRGKKKKRELGEDALKKAPTP
jgi:hypothetical protein